ncbi:hypothetical protein UO65_5729 [Actinokineospora spheciospongiae]|uniref:Excreted virulence factor EspC, type VII ESX diderm n=1 Tax=Actinokineospora spheciospongiae TaxID=909613 RepID=W7IDN9_9PSEU|nr:hypothetical protein [Actinokineospora spheciospongiae]EWC58995.1 hypothetical protein UO65_5729 [Actinokineospora spheciospongiae]PWW66514.1 hypothetical protein DFQ13_10130 [Actinokineospora spheciospongiae]
MTGFDVGPDVLRAAAAAARQAAGVVRALELGRVADLATALPGAASGATARELGPQWEDTSTRWAEGMDSYATALAASAEAYQAQEDAAADGFGRMGGR